MLKAIWTGLASLGLLAAPVMGQVPQAVAKDSRAAPKGPGKLIERQPLAAEFGLEEAAQASSIRYSSTDGVTGHGTVVVSGALFIPKGKRPAGGWPLIAWTHGTVGIGDDCAPSRQPRSDRDREYLNSWLKEGYAIVATDYQGLGMPGTHPYMNSRTAAYSALDSIRAVQGARLGIASKVVIVGQSQGGGAAFASAGYAPAYAPSINLQGTVATGTPYFTESTQMLDESAPPPILVAFHLLLAQAAYQIDPKSDPAQVISDKAMPAFKAAAEICLGGLARQAALAGLTPENSFKLSIAAMRDHFSAVLKSAGYSTLKLRSPVFIGSGSTDPMFRMQRKLVDDACAAGSIVEDHVYDGLGHSEAVNRSFTDSRVFVRKVMAGKPIASRCGAGAALR